MKNHINPKARPGRLWSTFCAAAGLAVVLASAVSAGLFGTKEIPSAWNASTIAVDGSGGAGNSAPTLPDAISFWLKVKLASKQ